MTRRHRILAAAAAVLGATLALVSASARATVSGAPEGIVANDERSFVTLCSFSHRNTDDPIVLPRQPGFSHDHTFVGNVSTDAFSTVKSLKKEGTTCDRKKDTAAYWSPTVYDNGKPVNPYGAVVYYRRLTAAKVRAYPDGLTVVAGNSHAGAPQSRRIAFWDCGVVKTTLYGKMARRSQPVPTPPAAASRPPDCPPASKLQMHVNFTDCWNGKTTDSVDHRRHMAYSVNGRCPKSHPVAVAALSLVVQYPPLHGTVTLSSGGIYSVHADFLNAWDEKALENLVDRCLNAVRPCGTGQ